MKLEFARSEEISRQSNEDGANTTSLDLEYQKAHQGPDHHTEARRWLYGSCTHGEVKTFPKRRGSICSASFTTHTVAVINNLPHAFSQHTGPEAKRFSSDWHSPLPSLLPTTSLF